MDVNDNRLAAGMALQINPHELEPAQFAKVCGGLIGIFFALIFVTGVFSGTGRHASARFLCGVSCVYFVSTTCFIMYGMIASFEVARSKYDKYNNV